MNMKKFLRFSLVFWAFLLLPIFSAKASATLSASPNPCDATEGSCTTTVSYQTSEKNKATQIWVTFPGGNEQKFHCAVDNITKDAPWINKGKTYEFYAYPATSCTSLDKDKRDSLKATSPHFSITGKDNGKYDSQFISTNAPTSTVMYPGGKQTVRVTMKNTGTKDWVENKTTGSSTRLGVGDNTNRNSALAGRALLRAGEVIKPGESKTFSYVISVASTTKAGNYDLQFQMLEKDVVWFGTKSPVVRVEVKPTPVNPVVSIESSDSSASESGITDTGKYVITRTGTTTKPLNINFTTSGSATRNTDYTIYTIPAAGLSAQSAYTTLTIPVNQASTTVTLFAKPDNIVERTETATISLDPSAAYTISQSASSTVSIFDSTSTSYRITPIYSTATTTLIKPPSLKLPDNTVNGYVYDKVVKVEGDDTNYVVGWVCPINGQKPKVNLYLGSPSEQGGAYLASATANIKISNDDGEAAKYACKSDGANYFKIPVASTTISSNPGKALFVHAISPSGGRNQVIPGVSYVPGEEKVYVKDYIVTSTPIKNNADLIGINDAFKKALEIAKSKSRSVEVVFEARDYEIGCGWTINATSALDNACLKIIGSKKENIILSGSLKTDGSRTKIKITQPLAGGIFVKNIDSFTVNQINIDHKVPPFTQGTVRLTNSTTSLIFTPDQNYPEISEDVINCLNGLDTSIKCTDRTKWRHWGMSYNSKGLSKKDYDRPDGDFLNPTVKKNNNVSYILDFKEDLATNNEKRLKNNILPATIGTFFRTGDKYVQLMCGGAIYSGFSFRENGAISVLNTEISSGGGPGLLFTVNTGNILIADYVVAPPVDKENRVLSLNAAPMLLQNNRGASTTMIHSYLSRTADDLFNSGTIPATTTNYNASTKRINVSRSGATNLFKIGDRVQVYSPATGTLRGSTTIQNVSTSGTSVTIALNDALSGVQVGDNVADIELATPNLVIRDSRFGPNRGNKLRIRSFNTLIKDNTFENINWSGISVAFGSKEFNEGPIANDVNIINNIFKGGNVVAQAPIVVGGTPTENRVLSIPTKVLIQNNEFSDFQTQCYVGGVGNPTTALLESSITLSGNTPTTGIYCPY
jgi:hypothetical protein